MSSSKGIAAIEREIDSLNNDIKDERKRLTELKSEYVTFDAHLSGLPAERSTTILTTAKGLLLSIFTGSV